VTALSGHGGELALAPLVDRGVGAVFTLSGGHIFPFFDACVRRGVRIVDVRHEQTATFAAEAMAKLTRGPGIAVLTAGPGVTNGVSAMLTSTDAVTWSAPVSAPYNFVYPSIREILWLADRNEYLVVGGETESGFIATSTTTDATVWHARFTSDPFTSVLWDGSRFIAIDDNGRVYTSADGVSWASQGIVPNNPLSRLSFFRHRHSNEVLNVLIPDG